MTKLIIQHLWSDLKTLARDSCDIGIVLYCYHFVFTFGFWFSWWIQKLTCFQRLN